MNIVWLEKDSMGVPLLRPRFPHTWTEFAYTGADQVAERMADAQVLVVNKCRIGAAQLDAAPALKLVCITATGTDNVDIAECSRRGIAVKNVVNYGPTAVAEHVMASLLTLTRYIREWDAAAHDGRWSESRFFCLHTYPMRSLSSMTLGLLGSGAIGSATGQYARAFGMKVVSLDRPGAVARPGYVAFEEGLAQVDVLSLHCPLNDATRGMFNVDVFARMKKGAVLINTARGALVNFKDLLDALERGQLGGAAIDVLEVEPPPLNHPMVQARHPRLILTPHIAWATFEAQTRLAEMVRDNIEQFAAAQASD